MQVLQLIENSALVDWFLTSMWGFPVFIALHSVGMAFVVGLSLIIGARHFGYLRDLHVTTVVKIIRIAWLGFALNFITGLFLLLSRVTQYLFDLTFLVKLALVFSAAIGLRLMQRGFKNGLETSSKGRRYLSHITIVCWFGAVTAGRWIAYLSGIYS